MRKRASEFVLITFQYTFVLGIVTLIKDYVVCKEGDVLTPEQANLLELLGHKLATFRLVLRAMWKKPGHFEKFSSIDQQEEDEDQEMENDVN